MRWYKALLLPLLLPWALLPSALIPSAVEAACPAYWPDTTFLQLYDSDLERPSNDWRQALSRWKSLGVEEVILQWSAYGTPQEGPFPVIESGTLERLLAAAEATAVRLRIGLRYDPGFWDDHEHDESSLHEDVPQAPSDLMRYLFQRWRDQQALIAVLAPLLPHPAFAGWYISDEIDDLRWRGPARRQLLSDYLAKLVKRLQEATPDTEIALSAFSNGFLPPLELGEFLQGLVAASGIGQLFFQDGIGAEKLEMTELDYYIPALTERFEGSDQSLAIIVELFEMNAAGDAFTAAAPERILQQLQKASASGRAPITFALPHHADPEATEEAARLAQELGQIKRRCGL